MPEIHNPNLQTQGSGGGGGGGDMRSTMAFMLVVLAGILGYQYFFMPSPNRRQQPAQTQQQSQTRCSRLTRGQRRIKPPCRLR